MSAYDAKGLGFEYLCEDRRDLLAETCADYLKKYNWQTPLFMVASFINPHDICFMTIADGNVGKELSVFCSI